MRRWLQRIWYRPQPPPFPLRPLAGVYATIADFRARRQRSAARPLPVPVVVVGNVTVGGTGKTPCVLWLAELARELGRRPGIVSRGYGGATSRPRLVQAGGDPCDYGDEPLWLAERSGVPVAVGVDRRRAVEHLLAHDASVDLVLSDDGLQHYRLWRDAELCVIDGTRGFGNGWRLPAGPLREPPTRVAACDLVLVNGGDAAGYGGRAVRVDLTIDHAVRLSDGVRRPLTAFAGTALHAVAGIGAPERFFAALRAHGLRPSEHPLADHQRYTPALLRFADDAPVLMTEKDAVKCRAFADPRLWVVPARLRPSPAATAAVRQLLTELTQPGGPRGGRPRDPGA